MLRNYFKIAIRSLKKNSLFSWLNIAGLSVGLAVTVLLFMFVLNELDFDNSFASRQNIYRVILNTTHSGHSEKWCTVPNAVAPAVAADIPEIKYAARMLKNGFGSNAFLKSGSNTFIEKSLYWCDADLLKIFDLHFINGHSQDALNRPNTVIISSTTAKKCLVMIMPLEK